MFYDYRHRKIPLQDFYRGAPAFLLVNGPSLSSMDLRALTAPGMLTIGVNNGPAAFRPNLWIMADDTGNFIKSTWLDPRIIKFVPHEKRDNDIRDNDKVQETPIGITPPTIGKKVGDCPSVVYYHREQKFYPDARWMTDELFNWGVHAYRCALCNWADEQKKDEGKPKDKICPRCGGSNWGCRSIMFLAVKLAYALGIRTLFIIGADFNMSRKYTYAFDQGRAERAVNNNNTYYEEMNRRFDLLDPVFRQHGFNVFNCTPDSGLKSFRTMPYEKALEVARKRLPPSYLSQSGHWICKENTEGLYERNAKDKEAREQQKKQKKSGMTLEEFING